MWLIMSAYRLLLKNKESDAQWLEAIKEFGSRYFVTAAAAVSGECFQR